ncbi:MAG: GNAT family N-acetyltransferase [Lentisphaeria bacterium]|nr:GNAT family N-acetyltransferase [Lentisphaeria bacterium]
MTEFISRFPLSRFDELVPLLRRCFPEFWNPRLQRGLRTFPYDLRLFTAKLDGKLIGTVGIHDYQFLLNGKNLLCGGLSDVGIDPDFRGRGYARQLQDFALRYCRNNPEFNCPMMPLYTDKPGVYLSQGWQLYEPDRSREICTEDFPKRNAFRLEYNLLGSPGNPEHEKIRLIQTIYREGQNFNGKCLRSAETWQELFREPEHEWELECDTYYLYRKDRLLEAYSANPSHPVRNFVPVQGGYGPNKLMLNLQCPEHELVREVVEEIRHSQLYFPIADTF